MSFFTQVQNGMIEFLTLRQHEKNNTCCFNKIFSLLQYVACMERSALHFYTKETAFSLLHFQDFIRSSHF